MLYDVTPQQNGENQNEMSTCLRLHIFSMIACDMISMRLVHISVFLLMITERAEGETDTDGEGGYGRRQCHQQTPRQQSFYRGKHKRWLICKMIHRVYDENMSQ